MFKLGTLNKISVKILLRFNFFNFKSFHIGNKAVSTGRLKPNKAGGKITGKTAVLAEGDAAGRGDIVYLETLPLFFK